MRVLIDECLPRQLKALLSPGYDSSTVLDVGLAGLQNGALLRAADPRFDVFITADKQLYHQQNFAGLKIAIVVLPTNRLRLVKDAVPALLQSLSRLELGQRILMDLGDDAAAWPQLRLESIVDEANYKKHVFKPPGL